jgi:rhodanese-related sulfurtransferase
MLTMNLHQSINTFNQRRWAEAQQQLPQLKDTALNLLSLEQAGLAFSRMIPVNVEPGDEIIKQGETGEQYFLLESGEAEVWRTDPIIDEISMVAILGPGSVFGEEALLIEGNRNATVRMRTAGKIWTLYKNDFDKILRNELLVSIESIEAKFLISIGVANWLDCRYEMEFEESHIPGTLHLPLDKLREHANKLDKSKALIVYCRSGRRSDAAAFLLRERGFSAYSLKGGIINYPFDVDSENTLADS